jgi:serine/threonine protein kinase
MKLWEFTDEQRDLIVGIQLSHLGKVIQKFTTPYSYIYTLQSQYSPNDYLIAKTPRVEVSLGPEEINSRLIRFLSEINNIYKVCHHSFISHFGRAEIIHGCPFLISAKKHMTLRDAIEDSKMDEVDVLTIAIQVVRALEYCNSKGIIAHQDMKPENIFLDSIHNKFAINGDYPFKYQAFLADLGMANSALLFCKPYGSRPYMSPEQYQNLNDKYPVVLTSNFIEKIAHEFQRSDIFAVGVLMAEMLTGGIHPIGERTSDVWPNSIRGNKWSHEDIWKKWSKSNFKVNSAIQIANVKLLQIINNCLSTSPLDRPDAGNLKMLLMDELKIVSKSAYLTLNVYVEQMDQAAIINKTEGWPYMDQLVDKLNDQI